MKQARMRRKAEGGAQGEGERREGKTETMCGSTEPEIFTV